jgi:hypothetical protein
MGGQLHLQGTGTASQFGHYILSFNINTNGWVASYIYKVPESFSYPSFFDIRYRAGYRITLPDILQRHYK